MRTTIIALIVFLIGVTGIANAQSVGDYRSNTTGGNWSAAGNWERWNGTAWSLPAAPPTGSETITIRATDSIFVNVAVSISGTLRNQGKIGGAPSLTFANGGMYEHAQNAGSIPEATWAAGSICKVTGYISGSKPNNLNQDFHHFVWNCTGQTANVDLGLTGGNTIHGNFEVDATGSVRVQLTSPAAILTPININGDIIVRGGQFSTNGSSSAATIIVNVLGNITVTGGNFSVSRGSAPDVTFNLYGDFTVSNATLQNSGATRINKLIFSGNGTHNLSFSNVQYGTTGTGHFTMEVAAGSTLNLGTSVITASNTGSFIVAPGGTVATGHADGLAGAIMCTGASNGGGNSFSTEGNYAFKGSVAQVTSALMPTTVNNLVINNAAGVALTQPTTINGVLRLMAGVFNNTVPFTLGPSGSISFEGGSLLVTSVENEGTIPQSFFVEQNYPNPFNPATAIRFGLPRESQVSIRVFNLIGQQVATVFEGKKQAGTHTLAFDATNLSSGVYIYRVQSGNLVESRRMVLLK